MTPPAVRLEATRINQARVSILCSLDKSAHNETVAFDSMIFIRSAVVPKKKTSFNLRGRIQKHWLLTQDRTCITTYCRYSRHVGLTKQSQEFLDNISYVTKLAMRMQGDIW